MARICPECRGEFRDEILRCPDCDIELVAEWALEQDKPETDHSPPVTVLSTGDVAALAAAKSFLEAAHIPYAVWNERAIEVFPGSDLRDRHGDAELQVPGAFVDEARRILARMEVDE